MEDVYRAQLIEEGGLTHKQIAEKIREKQEELQGLVTDEGAMFIMLRDLGIEPQGKPKNEALIEEIKESSDKSRPWYQEAKEAPIAGGLFLPIAYGFEYLLKFENVDDPRNDKAVNKKDMRGNDTIKYWYYVMLMGIKAKKATLEVLINEGLLTEDKVDRIKALEKKKEYLLELPRTARQSLGEFIVDNQLKNGEAFTMSRSGKGGQTKYQFKKVAGEN